MQADIRRDRIALNAQAALRHASLGQLTEAAACYGTIITLAPDIPEAHNNLGHVLEKQGHLPEAAASLRTAIGLKPGFPQAHYNLANVLEKQGHLDAAVSHYRTVIALQPDQPEAHNNLGYALGRLRSLDEAVVCLRWAIALNPRYAGAYNNLGYTLGELGRPAEAAECYRTAIAIDPAFHEAHNNLGLVLNEQGRTDEAVGCYRRALAIKPDFPEAHFHLGMALLARGEMAEGWAQYEWRWATADGIEEARHFAQPQWRGEDAAGRTVLIHAEQGFGDTLQFCRFASLVAERGLRIVMEVQPPLLRLLRGLPGVHRIVARGEELPDFDLHCPMLSLPPALNVTLATLPSAACYLQADQAQAAAWRMRLDQMKDARPRVGLVWAGALRASPALEAIDRRRSLPPERLAPLLELSGVHFTSLQKQGPDAPVCFPMTDFMPEMNDFADTAALIANLDLVISVDTAVAHMAAALGKPVWLLDRFDPCWRWLTGRTDSPWYPSLRIYRQRDPGDWDAVITEVARDLHSLGTNPR